MSKVRVASFAVSIDGYGAGPQQCLEHPLGVGGTMLHEWVFPTRTFQQRVLGHPDDAGEAGIDDDFAARGFENVGAWILGRNMFGPVRGAWSASEEWNGWWGDDPPYHTHVFVLTHHPRTSVVMDGGTVFHFVTEGIESALERARECAGPQRDVRIGGGVDTVRQYLQAGLVDEVHLAIAPVLLGSGECLLQDIDLPALGFRCVEHVGTPRASHVVLRRHA
jgi:dihydrofolate reductase